MPTITPNKKPGKSSKKSGAATSDGAAGERTWPRRFMVPRIKVVVALSVVFVLGWTITKIWEHVAPRVIYQQRYLLAADQIEITPRPEWIQADVLSEVVRNSGLDGRLSMLDDSFMTVVADAFTLHPWVKSVEQIAKKYPSGVKVELAYRRPIAVVEMSTPQGTMVLIPIDGHAVHLPVDDVPEIYKRYLPRIQNVATRPPLGQQWDDERVIGAADIAVRLRDSWGKLGLVDILPSSRPEILDEHRYYVYDLITKGGTRVVWGASPLRSPPGEDAFDTKLERLRLCIQDLGPLDSVTSPAVVDVRNQLSITPRTVKKKPESRTAKKEAAARTAQKETQSDEEKPLVK